MQERLPERSESLTSSLKAPIFAALAMLISGCSANVKNVMVQPLDVAARVTPANPPAPKNPRPAPKPPETSQDRILQLRNSKRDIEDLILELKTTIGRLEIVGDTRDLNEEELYELLISRKHLSEAVVRLKSIDTELRTWELIEKVDGPDDGNGGGLFDPSDDSLLDEK